MQQPIDNFFMPFISAVLAKKTILPIFLDVREIFPFADAFIICSGRSSRHVIAIAEYMVKTLKDQKIKVLHTEGMEQGHWVLLDYGDVVIHIFYEPVRPFYDLEGLWVDAKRIDLSINGHHEIEQFENDDDDEDDDYDENNDAINNEEEEEKGWKSI